jgi:UDP-N-acetylmuramyl pentapeptide phosphotransferase/UDP-N-acetylglucosamine-1-phosphate transferase
LAIFAGFISSLTLFGISTPSIQKVMAGAVLLFFIGLKDDIVAISPAKKFMVQFLATGIVVFLGDIRVVSFHGFLGIGDIPDGVSYAFSFLTIIGVTNAVNLIDGLDGLAGSITTFISLAFCIAFFVIKDYPFAFLSICLMGAVIGFLRYNIHKAIIFMGDTGSLQCGFLVSIMAIEFLRLDKVASSPSLAVAILCIPLYDTLRVFGWRIIKGRSPFSPDKNHIHHILSRSGLKTFQIVITLVGINFVLVSVTFLLRHLGDNIILPVLVTIFVLVTVGLEYLAKKFPEKKPQFAQEVFMEQEPV